MIMTCVLIIHDVLFSKTVALKGPVVTEMIVIAAWLVQQTAVFRGRRFTGNPARNVESGVFIT